MPDPSLALEEPLLTGVGFRLAPSKKALSLLAFFVSAGVVMRLCSPRSAGRGELLTEEELPISEAEIPVTEDPSMRRRRSAGGRRGEKIAEEDFEKMLQVKGTYSWNEKEVKPWMVEGGGSKIAGKPRGDGEGGMGGFGGEDEGEKGTGVVQMWNNEKGYGFITPDVAEASKENLFCHVNNVIGTIAKGDKVKYKARFNQRKGKKETFNVKKWVEGDPDSDEEKEKAKEDKDDDKDKEESEIEGDSKL